MNRLNALICGFSIAVLGTIADAAERPGTPDSVRYLQGVRRFADVVLERGRDTYGPQKTPLFVDGLHAQTLVPAIWKGKNPASGEVEDWVLCNFASQQALLRTLDGLTALTGDDRYRKAAEKAAGYAMEHLVTPSGLLYWGGHLAWDLGRDQPVGEGGAVTHELKGDQPYYALLWRVNPQATQRLTEAIWAGHVLDWSLLDYNRHAGVRRAIVAKWDSLFDDKVAVPFPAKGSNLSFVNFVMPLMHAGIALSIHGQHEPALLWTRRLVYRWQEARDPNTGLCGGQLSFRKQDRAFEALGHVYRQINEAKIVATYHQVNRYHELPLAQMQAAEDLGVAGGKSAQVGREFITWASEDLLTYARRSYDPKQGLFIAMMTDGTPLQGKESRLGYYIPESFAPQKPDGLLLWSYASAWRLTKRPGHWEMLQELVRRLRLGELGEAGGSGRQLALDTKCTDWRAVYAMLEIHRATGDQHVLAQACRIGDNLLKWQSSTGLFPRPERDFARTGDEVPLALLHLVAAIEGKRQMLPPPRLDNAFFHCVYQGPLDERQKKRDDARTYDNFVFYGAR